MVNYESWTDEDIEKVRKFAGMGMTAQQIATHFSNRSRNSVIGMCHRKNIELLTGKSRLQQRRLAVVRKKRENSVKPLNLPYAPKHKPGLKTILELGLFDCRAVVSEIDGIKTLYCGTTVAEGKSYCKEHHAIYTIPNTPRPHHGK